MSGTTSVALAMDSSFSSRRCSSSPDLLSLPALDSRTTSESLSLSKSMSQPHLLVNDSSGNGGSFASLTTFDIPSFNAEFELGALFLESQRPSSDKLAAPIEPLKTATQRPKSALSKSATSLGFQDLWMSASKSTGGVSDREQKRIAPSVEDKIPADGKSKLSDQLHPLDCRQTSNDNFLSSTKRSWMTSSRSPSPKSRPGSPADKAFKLDSPASHGKMKQSTVAHKQLEIPINHTNQDASLDNSKQGSKSFTRYFAKIKGKPNSSSSSSSSSNNNNNSNSNSGSGSGSSNLIKSSNEGIASNLSRASSAVSLGLPASSSIDTHASHSTHSDTNVSTPSITDESSTDMLPRMLDPLWSSFKNLDMEFRTFATKPMPSKMAQIQSLILPFLKGAASQASISHLQPEDIDRRATILNKWWGAILDVLEGHHQQPVPGVDRPVLLEVLTLLMMRPEWRQTTSYFLPLSERSPKERVQTRPRASTNASDTSQSSSQSAMLAESAEHNVRTMFVSNLVKQMAYVVDRMSLRHAPLSLVNFAGKTCAYAFFFAPGVADILVRLWALTPDLIRRAGDSFKLPRKDSGESEDIVALFPPKLGAFGWTSPRNTWDTLRHIPKLPMLVARIPWTGPWVSRWKGRDTDLFFIFCKYFHILSDEFMPSGLPLTEKARAPAFVLVHAQLLFAIDATVQRQAGAEAAHSSPLVDMAQSADASLAMPLPLPPTNLTKGMSENRLVILVKEILSNNCQKLRGAKHTFAESFAAMMKAAAYRTPRYNSNACFSLCDFLEEVLMIYNEAETPENPKSYIDWEFWIDICKKVLTSLNTLSEVRVLSFIYTIWDAVAKHSQWKLSLCRDWLLSEETFNALFNNWCPMVRAYFHRLLCWRICRDRGSRNEVDMEIFLLATKRLKVTWAHYLYLKQHAEESGGVGPSAAPMSPTLGKKFIIIRQEVNAHQPGGLLMGLDSSGRLSNQDLRLGENMTDSNGVVKKDDKKRWSLLGKVFSLAGTGVGSQNSLSDGFGGTNSSDDELRMARREVAESRVKPGTIPLSKSSKSLKSLDSGRSSPVLDEQKYIFKFILGWQQPPIPPRERHLVQPRLPTPAQARISVRSPSASPLLLPTRKTPGMSPGGLVQEARNASSLNVSSAEKRRDLSPSSSHLSASSAETAMRRRSATLSGTASPKSERLASLSSVSSSGIHFEAGELVETVTQPMKPAGIFQKTSVYSGRALAEWSLVVAECNNFVERRRDEGILGLDEVEVPLLSVDGFRRVVN